MKRLLCAAAALLALSVPIMGGQDTAPTPIFRSAVNLVQVDAYVTDGRGNPVPGLAAGDFEVREDGRPQSLRHFVSNDIPVEIPGPVPSGTAPFIEPDVQGNEVREGRLYIFAVDELRPENGLRARLFLRWFVERHMGENDLAAVVLIGKGRRVEISDQIVTDRVINELMGWTRRPASDSSWTGPRRRRSSTCDVRFWQALAGHVLSMAVSVQARALFD